jgi:hypothetical protein
VNHLGLLICATIAIGLSFGPTRQLIETSMVWHMAVQFPLLLLTGWFVGKRYSSWFNKPWVDRYNHQGLTGMLLVSLVLAYWMLPLAIDSALVNYSFDSLKIVSLMICGAILYDFFSRAHWVIQLFFLGYTLSMLAWLGVYFTNTDLRLCNAYSIESQAQAGKALLGLAILLGLAWVFTHRRLVRQYAV